MHKVICI